MLPNPPMIVVVSVITERKIIEDLIAQGVANILFKPFNLTPSIVNSGPL